MQHEAARVQEGIAAIVAEKAQLATRMEAQAQLLAAPDLLQNRPELRWEQAAAGSGPSLGSAKELFVRDRKLTDFRWVVAAQSVGHPQQAVGLQCKLALADITPSVPS